MKAKTKNTGLDAQAERGEREIEALRAKYSEAYEKYSDAHDHSRALLAQCELAQKELNDAVIYAKARRAVIKELLDQAANAIKL